MPFFTTSTTSRAANKDTMVSTKAGRKVNTTNPTTPAPTTTTPTEVTAPISSEPRVLKAVREFEHGRQRAKKSARTEIWKADKAAKRQLKAQKAQGTFEGPPIQHRSKKAGFARLDRDETLLDESDSAEEAFDVELIETPKWSKPEDNRLEVDLTKLIRPSKARRSKAGDFELIPSVRSVLVLEDAVLDRGIDSIEDDEPWEYLSAAGDDAEHNILSYAEVAATR